MCNVMCGGKQIQFLKLKYLFASVAYIRRAHPHLMYEPADLCSEKSEKSVAACIHGNSF